MFILQTQVKRSQREVPYPQFGLQMCLLYRHKFKGHIEKDHDLHSEFKCDYCGTNFTYKHKLNSHNEKDHIINSDFKYFHCTNTS